ncbi:MAG: SGNH/GDSL hydrolase family protein [Clostridiales bacterium]|nr:SGNH/GDSL hydrolase family protein [Clostridiales bacterium]
MSQNTGKNTKKQDMQEQNIDVDIDTDANVNIDEDSDTKKPAFQVNAHIVLVSIIVLIFAIIAFRLYKWNKGVQSSYDPNADIEVVELETLDIIMPMDPDNLEGHEDDGVTTILCLGNDPFFQNKGEKNGLAELIADKTGATVYNGSFGGSCIAASSTTYSDGEWIDAFSMPYLAQAMCSGDFSILRNVAELHSDEADFIPTIEMFENLDMNSVDMICIMYDGTDYLKQRGSDDPNNPYSIVAFTGALNFALTNIKETYPFIRIVVMSPPFCLTEDGESGRVTNLGNGTLYHYFLKEIDVVQYHGASIIDNYYGSISEANYLEYLSDNIHLNDKGRELIAQRFKDCIFGSDEDTEE